MICANGALVVDVAREQVLRSFPIGRDEALAAATALRAAIPGIVFARESLSGYGREPGFLPRIPPPVDSPVAPLEHLLDDGTVKLLARHERLTRDELLGRAVVALDGRLVASVSSGQALLEMSARGVTKAVTLARFAAERGVAPEGVIAFGDMVNDLPMLEWAGRGVAVANADPRVLAAADEVAPSNEDDGVAVVLERLLGEAAGPGGRTAPGARGIAL